MAKLIKCEVKELPELWIVGKELRHSNEELMQGNNRIPALWDACFVDGTFAILERLKEYIFDAAYVGLMIDWDKGDGNFSYICGMMMKPGCPLPNGFVMRELKATRVGMGWIQGKDTMDVCSVAHELTEKALKEAGHAYGHMKWSMEVYACPHFTTPDENGQIILDYYIPLDVEK